MIQLSLFNRWMNTRKTALVSAAFGIVFGTVFLGPRNVLPWNLQWLAAKGDGSADGGVSQIDLGDTSLNL